MLKGMQPPFWFTLVYFKIAELRKTTTDRTKSVCTHAGGVCLKMEIGRPFPEYYPIVPKRWEVDAQGAYMCSLG